MNETRYDWLSDRWVIFAPNREERPDQYRQLGSAPENTLIECPFCSGREHETPKPTLVLPENDFDQTSSNRRSHQPVNSARPWQVRVVPNKFPAIPQQDAFSESFERPTSASSILAESVNSIGGTSAQQVQTKSALHLFQRNTSRGAHEVIIESPIHVDSITALPADHVANIFEAYRRRLNHWRAQRHLKYAVVFKNYGADAGAS